MKILGAPETKVQIHWKYIGCAMEYLQLSNGAKTKYWAVVDKVGGSNPDEDMSFLEFIRLRERWRTLVEVRVKEDEM